MPLFPVTIPMQFQGEAVFLSALATVLHDATLKGNWFVERNELP
jgi:hypothetical protein